ncbi:MAG: hypothetical protein JJT75_07445 [Opitutales bacterium]|nr:hypothetical protein [Opitutales bacterium]MCH8540950.1 hypothetical protein [Opitutales bacterium]
MQKKIHTLGFRLLLLGLLTLLVGCASTPQKRIAENEAYFLALPKEDQERILDGEIALGFTSEMVRMALGSPDQVQRRVTAEKTETYWIYLGSFLVVDSYQVRDFARFSRVYHQRQVDRTRQQFYEKMRLVFQEDVLVEFGESRRGQ